MGFRVWGLEFGAYGLGFQVETWGVLKGFGGLLGPVQAYLGCRVWGLGFGNFRGKCYSPYYRNLHPVINKKPFRYVVVRSSREWGLSTRGRTSQLKVWALQLLEESPWNRKP